MTATGEIIRRQPATARRAHSPGHSRRATATFTRIPPGPGEDTVDARHYSEAWTASGNPNREAPGDNLVIHMDDGEGDDIEYATSPENA